MLPGEWGAPGLSPPRSVPCQQLCSVLQAGMKGLLSSCSPSSAAVASPSQQTNSQCWAQGQGGGSPHSAQPGMAVAEPWAPASPAFPWLGMGLPLSLCEGAGCTAGFWESGCLAHSPQSPQAATALAWPHLRVALSSNVLFPRHKVIFGLLIPLPRSQSEAL